MFAKLGQRARANQPFCVLTGVDTDCLSTYDPPRAQVAELVDALVSGTSGASREGSSPFLGTTFLN